MDIFAYLAPAGELNVLSWRKAVSAPAIYGGELLPV
jgi:hypothetical protein